MEPTPPTTPFEVPPPPTTTLQAAPFQVPPPPALFAAPSPRPGQLTPQWTIVFWVGWLLVAASFVAVWVSSRLLGLGTWWLGPSTEPRLFLISLLPLVAPLGLCIAGLMHLRWLPAWGVFGAAATAAIAAGDMAELPGFAAVQFALAAAGLLVSVACVAGMYRRAG